MAEGTTKYFSNTSTKTASIKYEWSSTPVVYNGETIFPLSKTTTTSASFTYTLSDWGANSSVVRSWYTVTCDTSGISSVSPSNGQHTFTPTVSSSGSFGITVNIFANAPKKTKDNQYNDFFTTKKGHTKDVKVLVYVAYIADTTTTTTTTTTSPGVYQDPTNPDAGITEYSNITDVDDDTRKDTPIICYPQVTLEDVDDGDEVDWTSNGACVLKPKSCVVTEEAGGTWELTLVEPMDDDGKWKHLVEGCVIKAPVPAHTCPAQKLTSADSGTVKVYKVTSDDSTYVRLRSSTDSFNHTTVEKLSVDTEVYLISEQDDYYEVRSPAGNSGFIHKKNLTYVRTETTATAYKTKTIRNQCFRVYEVINDSEQRTTTVNARHISYDFAGDMIKELKLTDEPISSAIKKMQEALVISDSRKIRTNLSDDVKITGDYSWKNPVNALLDPDEGFVKSLKCELVRDNYDFYLLDNSSPTDRGYTIRYGKNLKGVKWTFSTDDIVTRIIPKGTDADGNTLLLPQVYVDSDNIKKYSYVRCSTLDVDTGKVGEYTQDDGTKATRTQSEALENMRSEAKKQFDEVGVDGAQMTVEVTFQALEDTEEYKQYAVLANLYLYDLVHISYEPGNFTTTMQVASTEWDAILKRYNKITLGDCFEYNGATIAGYQIAAGTINGNRIVGGSISGDRLEASSITTDHLTAGCIDADKIQANSITTDHLQANSIDAEKIQANSITTEHLQANSIDADKIQANAITTDHLQANSIDAEKIQAGSITADKIQAGAIVTDTLAAHSVTADKIDTDSLTANTAFIGHLTGNLLEYEGGVITNLSGENVSYQNGFIASLAGEVLNYKGGTIWDISGTTATYQNGFFEQVSTDLLNADSGFFNSLTTTQAFADSLKANIIETDTLYVQSISGDTVSGRTVYMGTGLADHVVIENLDVTSALTSASIFAGNLYVNDEEGNQKQLVIHADGSISGETPTLNVSVDGSTIIKNSITTEQLNAAQIFSNEANISYLMANTAFINSLSSNQALLDAVSTHEIDTDSLLVKVREDLQWSSGTNLLPGTSEDDKTLSGTGRIEIGYFKTEPNYQVGRKCTFRAYITPTSGAWKVSLGFEGNDAKSAVVGDAIVGSAETGYEPYPAYSDGEETIGAAEPGWATTVFSIPKNVLYVHAYLYNTSEGAGECTYHSAKVEYGETPTAWSKANADYDSEINQLSTTISVQNGKITAITESTDGKLAEFQQTIDGFETRVKSAEDSFSTIDQTSETIALKVVGKTHFSSGANILTGTSDTQTTDFTNVTSGRYLIGRTRVIDESAGKKISFSLFDVSVSGEWYLRIGFEAKSNTSARVGDAIVGKAAVGLIGTMTYEQSEDAITANKYPSFTATIPDDTKWVSVYLVNASAMGSISVHSVKLQYGAYSTEWCESYTDIDSNIETTFEVANGRITSLIQDTNGKFSKVNQTVDGIETRVANAEGNYSTLNQTVNSISTTVGTLEGNYSTLKQTADSLSTEVTNGRGSYSSLSQRFSGVESRVTSAEGSISTFSQTATSIASSVVSQRFNSEIGDKTLEQWLADKNLATESELPTVNETTIKSLLGLSASDTVVSQASASAIIQNDNCIKAIVAGNTTYIAADGTTKTVASMSSISQDIGGLKAQAKRLNSDGYYVGTSLTITPDKINISSNGGNDAITVNDTALKISDNGYLGTSGAFFGSMDAGRVSFVQSQFSLRDMCAFRATIVFDANSKHSSNGYHCKWASVSIPAQYTERCYWTRSIGMVNMLGYNSMNPYEITIASVQYNAVVLKIRNIYDSSESALPPDDKTFTVDILLIRPVWGIDFGSTDADAMYQPTKSAIDSSNPYYSYASGDVNITDTDIS